MSRLALLKQAASILGEMPSTTTGDPEYRAYRILAEEIERLEDAVGDRTHVAKSAAVA